jgi:hypothetical protein
VRITLSNLKQIILIVKTLMMTLVCSRAIGVANRLLISNLTIQHELVVIIQAWAGTMNLNQTAVTTPLLDLLMTTLTNASNKS